MRQTLAEDAHVGHFGVVSVVVVAAAAVPHPPYLEFGPQAILTLISSYLPRPVKRKENLKKKKVEVRTKTYASDGGRHEMTFT